jgi:ubiquitin carboxyl-terminal hydrolase 34
MVIGRQFPRNLQALCRRGDEFLRRLSQDMAIDLPDHTSTDENTRILLGGWKFGILKKHFMEGRMELRVHGVEKMQAALVDVWKEYISQNPDGISDPFVQYLVRFIKENKIVDYLVGVDSHPQLIGRSSNIVGFLVVTSTYTDRETDVIWKAVTESQDSRIVSEVLSMLTKTFYMHTTASPALLYLCEKLSSLPLDKFDAGMLEFCDSLLGQMTPRHNPGHMFMDQSDTQHAHAIPLRLCVRMIRESTVAEDLSADQRTKLQSFGSRKLSDFIKAGIGEDDRMEMYERCIQDIAEMNQFTTGSIQALSALVPHWDASEMRKLATDFDLTRLVINDMLHTVNGTNFDLADCFSQHGLVSRVEILSRLINQAPETVTPELGSALWNQILLSSKLGPEGHRTVWAMMVNSLSRSAAPNSFLDQCINEHMPHLAPKDYDFELLLFAKQSVNYEIRFKPPPAAGENEIVFIPGMDRIWDIILTAPPGTVEADATKFAIEVYLDHQIIQTAPRSAVDATHVSIVGRCVKQLKSAAATINTRPRSDGVATNGATEMEIGDASESEELDELMFTRSLLFLHQLLEGLRTRPRYSPPQGSPPTLPQRPLRGSPLDLRWQSFRDGIQSQIQSLRIGDDSTAAELTERLTQLTGFSKFSTIAAGARLDLFEKPDTRLKEIKALQAGLLIIRKSPDAEELQRSNKCQPLTSVDSEVMKYFDDIYQFLALSEPLAEQVRNMPVFFQLDLY